jgi:hypothetical protein
MIFSIPIITSFPNSGEFTKGIASGSCLLELSSPGVLESITANVKRIEDNVTIREMQLELKCQNAGLITPIELKEVEHIIELDNYDDLLQEMINKRVEIQEQVKVQLEQQEAKKQELLRQEELRKQNEALELEKAKELQLQKENEAKIEAQKQTGKKIVSIVATFKIEVPFDMSDLKVVEKYEQKLKEIFSTLESVKVV